MASLFKRRNSRFWLAAWTDPATGERAERSTRTTEKRLAEKLARAWEDRAIEVANGLVDTRAESLAAHEARPLDRHLDDFLVFLNDKGTEWKQIDLLQSRITKVLEHIGAERLSDVTASAVLSAISEFRRPDVLTPRGLSAQTATHYVRAMKEFSRWLFRHKRIADDPLVCLTTFNAEADRRRVRRDLSPEELARLITAAESAPVVTVIKPVRKDGERIETQVRMRLPDRAWAYRIAAATGFRASEISTLTPESFDLEADPPTATVEAGYSKRRRRDVQPLPRSLIAPLRAWLAHKAAGAAVCPLPTGKAALVLAADLAAARATWLGEARSPKERAERERSDFLRYTDSAGHTADFHSLRGHYISRVVESGANLKEAMELARHSDPKLTMRTYARVRLHDLSAVVDRAAAGSPASPRPARSA
jgi:integrase